MATNIAQTIQQGTRQQAAGSEAMLNRMEGAGETIANNSLKEAGMRLQMQEMVDTKASAFMKGLDMKQMNLSSAKKGMQAIQDQRYLRYCRFYTNHYHTLSYLIRKKQCMGH